MYPEMRIVNVQGNRLNKLYTYYWPVKYESKQSNDIHWLKTLADFNKSTEKKQIPGKGSI